MAAQNESRRSEREGERGHLMAGLVAAITIMLLFSTITFQAWEEVVRRDNEAEMMFRAKSIARGILRYRKDHGGAAPMTLEQLAEPGPQGQFYLRGLQEDPLVKDGKWGLLYVGPGGNIIDPSEQPQQSRSALPALAAGFEEVRPEEKNTGLQGVGNTGGIGMPIAGVKSLCTDDPFRVFNGVADYSKWQFTFVDLETGLATGGGAGGRGMRPGAGGRGAGAQQGQVPGLPQQGSSGVNRQGNKNP